MGRAHRLFLRLSFAVLAAFLSSAAAAAPPQKLWELAGFDAPKSVLYDARTNSYFVSSMNGDAMARDGNGYISQVTTDGRLIRKLWFAGLNAPKGMAVSGKYLLIADIDELVVIHKLKATLRRRFRAPRSKYLADVAVDGAGRIYVSDMLDDAIYRLDQGVLGKWVASARLMAPTAIKVVKNALWVASWGRIVQGFETNEPGHLLSIDLDSRKIKDIGRGYPIGNLDGLEPIGGERFVVTDGRAGGMLMVDQYGRSQVIEPLPTGAADMGFDPLLKQVVVPLTAEGKIVAYQFD